LIARLCELASESVREAEDEDRLANTEESLHLLRDTRIWAGRVVIYVERLKLRGAQVGTLPAIKGEDHGS
jgi:hypothetical protein